MTEWAHECQIRPQIYNMALHKHAGTVAKPESVIAAPTSECFLYWHPDGPLYVGWSTTVMVSVKGHVAFLRRIGFCLDRLVYTE